jgi:hypothetical protein
VEIPPTNREWKRETAQGERCRLQVCLTSEPSPLLFIGGEGHKGSPEAPRECTKGPMGQLHSLADRLWARLALSFDQVDDMWALGYILGVCNILRQFGRLVGPWILMTSMWRILIHQVCLPWMTWHGCMDTGGSHVAASQWLNLKCLAQMYMFSIYFVCWIPAFE